MCKARPLASFFASLLTIGVAVECCSGADWLQFRGNDNTGAAAGKSPPVEWTVGDAPENIAWKAPLPGRGVSGPIIVKGRVYVTAASGNPQDQLAKEDRLYVLCFDAATGKRLWERSFWATGRTLCHPTSSVAAPTPASDGERIFAFFSSNDLICLDLDGNLLWFRGLTHDFPAAANDVGMAASPLVVGETVVVQVENKGESFAAGLNIATGESRWKAPRKQGMNWSSPAVLRGMSREQDLVLLQSPDGLSAHNPLSGAVAWTHDAGCAGIPSAMAIANIVLAPSSGLTALAPAEGGAKVLWRSSELSPGNASPVVHRNRVYVMNGSVLRCGDAATGKEAWELRLDGNFWATPITAGDYLYAFNEEGVGQVVSLAGSKGKLVGENNLNDPVLGTPAIVDGALYVRSTHALWKIAAP